LHEPLSVPLVFASVAVVVVVVMVMVMIGVGGDAGADRCRMGWCGWGAMMMTWSISR
jgi:hypothetical protein